MCVYLSVCFGWTGFLLWVGRLFWDQTETHCHCCKSVFTLLWLACFICVSLTGQFYLLMFERLCFWVVLACCVSLICVSCHTEKRKSICLFGLKGNYSSILNEFSFMNVCLWIQIIQTLAVYVLEWADQTKDTKWGKMRIYIYIVDQYELLYIFTTKRTSNWCF